MVGDPYKVLGVAQGASQEEIKRAYRRKAKECHPDLHPDDPNAEKKMNEINEAYDMLMNPEKYARQRQEEQARQAYSQGYGNPYQGYGGGFGGFGGFGFDDFFGFGGYDMGSRPVEQPGDSEPVRQAVRYLNQRQYQAALSILANIPTAARNARWNYLCALANKGMGNTIAATDHMERAVQMEPGNTLYRQLLQQYVQSGRTYQQNARGYNTKAMDPSRLCMNLCLMQMFCGFCRCC